MRQEDWSFRAEDGANTPLRHAEVGRGGAPFGKWGGGEGRAVRLEMAKAVNKLIRIA